MKTPTLKEIKQLVTFTRDSKGMLEVCDVYGAVVGNVGGNVKGSVFGDVEGDVGGAVEGDVEGAVFGNVGGNVYGAVEGAVYGNVEGDVKGCVGGNVEGDVGGDVGGDVRGNVEGFVGGDVYVAVKGCVGGDVEGEVEDAVFGNVGGNVKGDVDRAINWMTLTEYKARKVAAAGGSNQTEIQTPEHMHRDERQHEPENNIMENDNNEQQGRDSGCNTASCYAKDDPLHAIQRAIGYCEAYNIEKGSKMYEVVIAAYSTGYHNGLNKI